MKPRFLFLLVALTMLLEIPGFAGKFSGWKGPFKVAVQIPEPPVAYIGKKTAKIEVTNAIGEISPDQMRSLIEQALAPDIIATDPNPEALFKVHIVSFEQPTAKQYTLSERMQVKVGERPVYNKDGTPKKFLGTPVTEPVYEERLVPVQYWEGNGSLSMSVDVLSSSGARLDAFTPHIIFNQKLRLSVGSESTPEAAHVPDQREMIHSLANQLAAQVRRRYATTERPETVLLAIDDELKAGNEMARAGKWDDALNQWAGVTMKKNASDRIFNMAVANEMLAYAKYRSTQDMQASFPLFTKAMDMYAQALQADPSEKYIQQAQARITRAKSNMEAALKQYQAQSFEAEKIAQEIAARQKDEDEIAALIKQGENRQGEKGDLPETDSPGEQKFRTYARTHMNNLTGDPSSEQISAMLAAGKDLYSIDSEPGKKIVYQEIGRKHRHDKGISLYRQNLAQFSKNKRLKPEERGILNDISKEYGLGQTETGELEQQSGIVNPPAKLAAPAPKTPSRPHVAPKPAQSN